MKNIFKHMSVLASGFLLLQATSTNCMLRNTARTRSLLTAARNFASNNKQYDYLFVSVEYWMRSDFQQKYKSIIAQQAQNGWRFKDIVIPPTGAYETNEERKAEIIFERAVKRAQ